MMKVNSSRTTVKKSATNNNNSISLAPKPSENLSLLFNQFNNFSPERQNEPENFVNSKYYDNDEFQILKFPEINKSLSLVHRKCANNVSDIAAVIEIKITKKTSLTNASFQNSFEFTPTESNAGGTLLYIANHLPYKPRTNLSLNKANQLESTFIEIINSRKAISLLVVFIDILI